MGQRGVEDDSQMPGSGSQVDGGGVTEAKALEEEQVWTWAGRTWGSMQWAGGGEDTEKFKMCKLRVLPYAV